MKSLFCKYCGKPTDADSKYCMHCGKLLNYSNDPEVTPADSSDVSKQLHSNQAEQPIPHSRQSHSRSPVTKTPKYDENYEKDYWPVLIGGLFFFINFIWVLSGLEFESRDFFIVFNVIWRIIVVFWVIDIATRLNRNKAGWGVAAFMAPNLVLIIIGLQKKLFKAEDIDIQYHLDTGNNNESLAKEWQCPNCYAIMLNDGKYICKSCDYSYDGKPGGLKPRNVSFR